MKRKFTSCVSPSPERESCPSPTPLEPFEFQSVQPASKEEEEEEKQLEQIFSRKQPIPSMPSLPVSPREERKKRVPLSLPIVPTIVPTVKKPRKSKKDTQKRQETEFTYNYPLIQSVRENKKFYGEFGKLYQYQNEHIELKNKDIPSALWSLLENFGDYFRELVKLEDVHSIPLSYATQKIGLILSHLAHNSIRGLWKTIHSLSSTNQNKIISASQQWAVIRNMTLDPLVQHWIQIIIDFEKLISKSSGLQKFSQEIEKLRKRILINYSSLCRLLNEAEKYCYPSHWSQR